MKLLLLICLLFACTTTWHSEQPASHSTELSHKSMRYTTLIEPFRDHNGFILAEKCDSLLFSGLYSAAVGGTNILAAYDGSRWHRRPAHDCSPTLGNSRSTISRDMILGLLWSIWKNKNLDIANQLMSDLRSKAYYLRGEGTPGELFMTPALINTLARIIQGLGGVTHSFELSFRADISSKTGYISHLAVWHILLRGDITGKIPQKHFDLLSYHAKRNPLNPLFQAAYHKYLDKDQTIAIKLLLDKAEWPNITLPTSEQHCSEWVIQRDYTEKDWGPCTPTRYHLGAELPIMYNLIIAS